MAYFRLVLTVRSADRRAVKRAPHQLEPKPPGLMLVTKTGQLRGVIAGESVAIGLAQVGVGVAQVKREHLPGPADASAPGGVAGVRDAGGERGAGAGSVERVAGAEIPVADVAGNVRLHAGANAAKVYLALPPKKMPSAPVLSTFGE